MLLNLASLQKKLKLRLVRQKDLHPIYIVPTTDGLKVVALNLLLLIIGLIYANNFVLLFNFILFCIFLGSMFYTHFNLKGLTLKSIKVQNSFAKEQNSLILNFSSDNKLGHFHIQTEIVSDIDLSQSDLDYFDFIDSSKSLFIEKNISFNQRGVYDINNLLISTTFPLNFFRAFTVFNFQKQIHVYPERIDFSIKQVEESIGSNIDEQEDFQHENYVIGESLKRIDWKKFAKSNKLLIKKDTSQSFDQVDIVIDYDPLIKEQALSQAAFNIHQAHSLGLKYNIVHGDIKIQHEENQSSFYDKCLIYIGRL